MKTERCYDHDGVCFSFVTFILCSRDELVFKFCIYNVCCTSNSPRRCLYTITTERKSEVRERRFAGDGFVELRKSFIRVRLAGVGRKQTQVLGQGC
jgi:hypothetical protein